MMCDVVAAEDQRADQQAGKPSPVLQREPYSEFCKECGEPLWAGTWDETDIHIGWWCFECEIDYDLDGNLVGEVSSSIDSASVEKQRQKERKDNG